VNFSEENITLSKIIKQNGEILNKLEENFPTVKISKKAEGEKKKLLELFLSKILDIKTANDDLAYILNHKDYDKILSEEDKKDITLIKAFLESSYLAEISKNYKSFFSQKEMMMFPLLISNLKSIRHTLK
jgi:hypothetical protein